jgi:hypothetical protein
MSIEFKNIVGEASCIYSTINGGGKSHHIMKSVYDLNESSPYYYCYKKIPIRESMTMYLSNYLIFYQSI